MKPNMKRFLLSALFTVMAISLLSAQQKENWYGNVTAADSSAVVDAQWRRVEIENGVYYMSLSFEGNLFSSNQFISAVEFTPSANGVAMELLCSEQERKGTSQMASEAGVLAAVNGNFFSFNKPHNAVCHLVVGGRLINGNGDENRTKRGRTNDGVLIIDSCSRVTIANPDDLDMDFEKRLGDPYVMSCGPLLMHAGATLPIEEVSFNYNRHPRTAIAVFPNGKIWLVCVDGRSTQANGMSLVEMRAFFKWLGAKDLLNLDGGGSTALYIEKSVADSKGIENSNGIVSYPCDNKKFDHNGERRVPNCVAIRVVEKQHSLE